MRYFPDPVSGWLFLGALAAVLAIASYNDERYTKVPKWLTLPALALGVLLSCLRGAWLGYHDMAGYWFRTPGVGLGALDGLLFALAGFAVGFALFFTVWLLGGCGGGDVKLFAALGAWLGPFLVFCVLVVSMLLLSLCLAGVLVLRLLRGRSVVPPTGQSGRRKSAVIVRFSLVAAVAVLLVAAWSFRVDLGLARPQPAAPITEVASHAAR